MKKITNIFICLLIITSGLGSFFGNTISASPNDKIEDKNVDYEKIYLANNCFMYEKTTTGKLPPLDCGEDVDLNLVSAPIVIDGVPVYIWQHGCAPTAAGMVIGYWDSIGYSDLVDKSANEMIASSGNYDDYCLPLDNPSDIKPDKSEKPEGDEHGDNSVADFMETSQSVYHLSYGATWLGDIVYGMKDYINWKCPQIIAVINGGVSSFSWEIYCGEIDANRPVLLVVDCNGDGSVDHAITGIGYDDNHNYACYNTWNTDIHWYKFSDVAEGNPWGVYGGVMCSFTPGDAPNKPIKPSGPTSGKIGTSYTYSTSTTDPNGDQILYKFDWGDETTSGWIGPYISGQTVTASHTWSTQGSHIIKVKAKDTEEHVSLWSDSLTVSISKSRGTRSYLTRLLENLIEKFPRIAKLLDLPFFEKLLNLQ